MGLRPNLCLGGIDERVFCWITASETLQATHRVALAVSKSVIYRLDVYKVNLASGSNTASETSSVRTPNCKRAVIKRKHARFFGILHLSKLPVFCV